MDHGISGDVNAKAKVKQPFGALVEDETLVGLTDGSVKPKQPDGKVEEGATDERENRRK